MKRLLIVLLTLVSSPLSAAADEPWPRVEIGGHAGVLFGIETMFIVVSAGPRLSVNFNEVVGLDVIGEVVGPADSKREGVYHVQMRGVIRKGTADRAAIFVTGGTAGLFRSSDFDAPFGLSGGIGVQQPIAKYLAIRVDAQGIYVFERFWIVRGALGISIPIGGYR